MASIEIKHVGPLVDTGRIELKTVNLFIGKQSTGKSTLMKILCHCRWVEKTLMTHSPYVLTTLNVLMLASAAYKKDKEATAKVVPESCILPVGSIGAYYITEEGTLQDIVNTELQMISGLQLDGVSDKVDDCIAALNNIIYG
ncbi:MAG: ATP-binding protein [Mediterranea sp.]|jgi:hypothetical protein|nr:ATP-binding protein [Mediterranea sp.]